MKKFPTQITSISTFLNSRSPQTNLESGWISNFNSRFFFLRYYTFRVTVSFRKYTTKRQSVFLQLSAVADLIENPIIGKINNFWKMQHLLERTKAFNLWKYSVELMTLPNFSKRFPRTLLPNLIMMRIKNQTKEQVPKSARQCRGRLGLQLDVLVEYILKINVRSNSVFRAIAIVC